MAPNERDVGYPFFLTNPFWESTFPEEANSISAFALRRYSCNSGTASGTEEHDATLHALLEAIERDAVGVELLRTTVHRTPAPVRRIVRDSFPDSLQILLKELEADRTQLLGAWDISALDIGVPVALVGLADLTSGLHAYGTGASLTKEYAFERAALEAMQSVHMHRTLTNVRPTRSFETVPPAYLRCAIDRGYFLYQGGSTDVVFEETCAQLDSVEQQIETLCGRLRSLGMSVLRRSLLDGAVSVQQVVVPQLERFHLVTAGVPVLPGPRGKRVLNSSSSALSFSTP